MRYFITKCLQWKPLFHHAFRDTNRLLIRVALSGCIIAPGYTIYCKSPKKFTSVQRREVMLFQTYDYKLQYSVSTVFKGINPSVLMLMDLKTEWMILTLFYF